MEKNRKRETKQMRNLLGAFLIGCLLEIALFFLDRYYLYGTGEQMLTAYRVLTRLPLVGLAFAVIGLILLIRRKKWGLWLLAGGAFTALVTFIMTEFDISIITGLLYLVPALMLLVAVYGLYGKEFFFVADAYTLAIVVIQYWRSRYALSQYRPVGLTLLAVIALLLLLTTLFLWRACKSEGVLTLFGRSVRLLPEDADKLFLFGSLALSLCAVVVSALFGVCSLYAIVILSVGLFVSAVYYTVSAF